MPVNRNVAPSGLAPGGNPSSSNTKRCSPAGAPATGVGNGSADFAKAIDLAADQSANGMGTRSRRYAMLVEDGVVKKLQVDEPGKFEVSGGDNLLAAL